MPFLKEKGSSNAGVLISVILLSCVIVLSGHTDSADFIYVVAFTFILLSAVLILFWWRSRLTRIYIERLRADEVRRLENAIWEKEERIGELEAHNEALAKIIHKDNKLIPAMELSVREYLQSSRRVDDAQLQEKGRMLLEQLRTMSRERSGIIEDYRSACKKLPASEVVSVDTLMNYMSGKARENGIELELTISGSVKYMTENIVSASDLTTLLADLIENAITASKYSDNKKILVLIGIVDSFYMIDVFDSGIAFEPETLVNLGLKQMTTHASSGGSGIGMMTTFEILNRYNASMIIEEYTDDDCIYTKKISVIFDRQNQYTVITGREDEIKTIMRRENLLVGS